MRHTNTWKERKHTHTHTDTVIFSEPCFTETPANNPYNLTILRNLMDQSITPSNLAAIQHAEMKRIKTQV